MKKVLTAKFKLLPDEETKKLLLETIWAYRDACNYVSAYIFINQTLNLKQLEKAMYYELRNRFGLKAQMAISAIRVTQAQYKLMEAQHNIWKQIHFRKPKIDLLWIRDYSVINDQLSISTLRSRVKVPFVNSGSPLDGEFGTAQLLYRHGRILLHVPVECDVPDVCINDINYIVGIDRGLRFLATTYDSSGRTCFFSGAEFKNKRNHYHELKRQLRLIGTASSRRRLKEICEKESRWVQDVNHRISKMIVQSYPKGTLFVLEDLTNIQKRINNLHSKDQHNISSWPYYDLEAKITYKAAMNGQMVIKVDPAYTSQTCPFCGRRNRSSRKKSKHIYKCTSCRYETNDDRVAALNLYGMGMKYLVQSGESMPLFDGARSTVPDARPVLENPFSE